MREVKTEQTHKQDIKLSGIAFKLPVINMFKKKSEEFHSKTGNYGGSE